MGDGVPLAIERTPERSAVAIADGIPLVSGKIEVAGERDGDAGEIVFTIDELREARQLLGGGDGVLSLGAARVVPGGVDAAVPGVDGALGPRNSGREERGERERERRDDAD